MTNTRSVTLTPQQVEALRKVLDAVDSLSDDSRMIGGGTWDHCRWCRSMAASGEKIDHDGDCVIPIARDLKAQME